jgi:23S rRNA pseudouridine2605 synthase
MRINKFIAKCGICSRRQADKLIISGKIKINDKIVTELATIISNKDQVFYENQLLKISQTELYIFYKPRGYINSHRDPQNRNTIFSLLPDNMSNFHSIGRLDINSEGLILLTNDGSLKRLYELPKNNFKRVYKVRIFGKITAAEINLLAQGVEIEQIKYKPILIKVIREATNSWLEVILTEGKNREIRKVLGFFGYQVNRLIRVKYENYEIGSLKPGEYRKIK